MLLFLVWFQSTYLYKVRRKGEKYNFKQFLFQSTYLYKVRPLSCFVVLRLLLFQSTYLYKVRRIIASISNIGIMFQSTYLYKVRLSCRDTKSCTCQRFNPRTYIRYDFIYTDVIISALGFNPRTYIRYDQHDY